MNWRETIADPELRQKMREYREQHKQMVYNGRLITFE